MVDTGIDIVVTSPSGHTDLVVEVKLARRLDEATAQVREYMRGVGSSAGLVVGVDHIVLLRETYRGTPSIQVVGEYPLRLARGLQVSDDPLEYEERVQRWLESLLMSDSAAEEPLLSALREHILPVLADGTVSAAGPRSYVALHH